MLPGYLARWPCRYLAFIGVFCIEAALSLMTGLNINQNPKSWAQIAKPSKHGTPALVLAAPGLAAAVLLTVVHRISRHYAVLPTVILAIPAVFYIVLAVSHSSLDDARGRGWLDASDGASVEFWQIFHLFDPRLVKWSAMPRAIPNWFGLYFVVAFGSSLDVAAIEMATASALDYNKELCTVGISNLISGLTGGFSGNILVMATY